MRMLNTLSEAYPALHRCAERAGEEIIRACMVVTPESWERVCRLTLDRLVEEGLLAEWSGLGIRPAARSVIFTCRPAFVPAAARILTDVSLSVPSAYV